MLAIVSRNSEACSLSVPLILLGDAIRHLMMCTPRSRVKSTVFTPVLSYRSDVGTVKLHETETTNFFQGNKQFCNYLDLYILTYIPYTWFCVKSLFEQLKHLGLVPSEMLCREKMGGVVFFSKKLGLCTFSWCFVDVVMLGITSCQGRMFWSPANLTNNGLRSLPIICLFGVGYIFWNPLLKKPPMKYSA